MDCAYQGFASGSLEKDAFAVRLFLESGIEMMVGQSFAKNFGLYGKWQILLFTYFQGERVGALHVVCANKQVVDAVRSQLKMIARATYSNPPIHGAYIVSTILRNPELFQEWYRL